MKKMFQLLAVMVFTITTSFAQFADPAISGAYFTDDHIPVDDQSMLVVSFANSGGTAIPANSVEILVSMPDDYYSTDGSSQPTGVGASIFSWTYLGSDTWRGINNTSVPAFGGGDLQFVVVGRNASDAFETANVNLSVLSNFNQFSDNTANNAQQPALLILPAVIACDNPTPAIVGDFYGCRGSIVQVKVDTFDADHTYTWAISGAATIISTTLGQVNIQLPNTATGTFTLSLVEEVDDECVGVATQTIYIEQPLALVCDDNLRLSLNDDCELALTADMILEGNTYPNESYTITVKNSAGQTLPTLLSGTTYIAKIVTVSVKHDCSGNSCWGTVTLEDKVAPVIECPEPDTISCLSTAPIFRPTATDNCDASVPTVILSNDLVTNGCGNNIVATRTIIYRATDDFGNVSDDCVQIVRYESESVDSIKFPHNLDDVDPAFPSLACDNDPNWDNNGNGYPDIAETGFPKLNGLDVKQNNGLCKFNVVFTDQRIDICAASFKIIRTWTVLEWCSGNIRTQTQIIKVLDKVGPILICNVDFGNKYVTRPYECLADVKLPRPILSYDCSADSNAYTVSYLLADAFGNPPVNGLYITTNVVRNPDSTYTIKNLPPGLTWIKYTARDRCNNTRECFTEVYVEDGVPPVAICDQHTVVSLTNGGHAQVYATTFDDGSYDNCGETSLEVARMVAGCGSNTQFKESAIFCCDDIGKENIVQLRVWDDANGNGIFGDEIDLYIDSNNSGMLGDIVNGERDRLIKRLKDNSNTCMVNVKVEDKAPPVITYCPPNITINCQASQDTAFTGGGARAIDNCSGVLVTYAQSGGVDNCWEGEIIRTWLATDKSMLTATCTQRIKITDLTPFVESNINWSGINIRNISGCGADDISPDVMGRPTWTNDECSLVAASYEDQTFNFVDSLCVKILRTWTVIDWCTFDENNPNNGGRYSRIQEIKIFNNIVPSFTDCKNITVNVDGPDCNGFVNLVTPATDDCTPADKLKYFYTIDLLSDGDIDRTGTSADASNVFDPGVHAVKYVVSDGCGNEKKCDFKLTVKDNKKPTPYCYTELITVVMNDPSNKRVAIWARDYDKGSFDNCGGVLKFSFSENVLDTGRVFTCDSVGIRDLNMWVTDTTGNKDFCAVKVEIQATDGICDDGMRLAGSITSEKDEAMKEVTLSLSQLNSQVVKSATTNANGEYQFFGIKENENYKLNAFKDIDPMNGISTLDLVLIQRHILGLSKFTTPYAFIAADVNNSKSITASDLVALRKVVLGIDAKFANNTSWRFLDKNQTFTNPTAPWPFIETFDLKGSDVSSKQFDFMGVKVGDVNLTAKANLANNTIEPRTSNPLSLVVDNANFKKGQLVKVAVLSQDAYGFQGMQTTMKFDIKKVRFVGIEGSAIAVDHNNFNAGAAERGMIAISIAEGRLASLSAESMLFSFFFEAKEDGNLKDLLYLGDELLQNEAYDHNLEAQVIDLRVREAGEVSFFSMGQNIPNPFTQSTRVPFEIGGESDVTISIFDMSGKLVFKKENNYKAGKHEIVIHNSELNATGILTYQIATKYGSAIKKMVIVK